MLCQTGEVQSRCRRFTPPICTYRNTRPLFEDIARIYDVSGNPLVKAGKLSKTDALRVWFFCLIFQKNSNPKWLVAQAFMSHWHLAGTKHTDDVTEADFIEYYDVRNEEIKEQNYNNIASCIKYKMTLA